MKNVLLRLYDHQVLGRDEARNVLMNISEGKYNECMIASFLSVYLMRSITLDELSGFRDALLEMCLRVDLSEFRPIDIVGTGGDNKNTFNISTLSGLVVAGAGYPVAKHGNYGATSISGASNVLEQFGVKFTSDASSLKRSLEKSGFCFLHAPLFSPAMKAVAPIRKSLGVRTFFNVLGPLVNPCFPEYQLLGVYNLKMARLYHYMYQHLKDIHFSVVFSLDGYDEISLTGGFKWISEQGEVLMHPEDLGFQLSKPEDLEAGQSLAEAAAIFDRVLHGTGTPAQMNAVMANAAVAIRTLCPSKSLEECLEEARGSLLGGKSLLVFKRYLDSLN